MAGKEKIIIVGGPTASGKSDLALSIAHRINGEIISADSMQIYRDMNVGTAKVTVSEMDGIPHHMIDVAEPTANFSVSEYVDMTRPIIDSIAQRGSVPVIVGGTGLYIDALMYDYAFNNANVDEAYRAELNTLAHEKGNEYVHDMLRSVDPNEAENIHPNNLKRVIRALEICRAGGIKSENKRTLRYDTLMFVIDPDREILYNRINARVESMLNSGLEDEIRRLLDRGVTFDMQSMQAIGYKEWRGYLDGIDSLEDVISAIQKNSRNYAKRQLTWFRNKYREIAHLIPSNDESLTTQYVNNFLDI